jgi:hypothetical protein
MATAAVCLPVCITTAVGSMLGNGPEKMVDAHQNAKDQEKMSRAIENPAVEMAMLQRD